MSTAAKVTLATSIVATVGIISFVHYKQKNDQMVMREGVLRDMERQDKKAQNLMELNRQKAMTKALLQQREQEEQHLKHESS
ncbi:Hypothetical predicted protein [Mytilus galloprovincialis]|uniref:Protein PET117 homolog, mitochondrial n=1 Tax=Mytilus galloprovincialis TaxID=29158 RepID=A0A8B6EB91_MYTGA|nr:Hypothetical predicted protein [Mytilus galloprovincialis]